MRNSIIMIAILVWMAAYVQIMELSFGNQTPFRPFGNTKQFSILGNGSPGYCKTLLSQKVRKVLVGEDLVERLPGAGDSPHRRQPGLFHAGFGQVQFSSSDLLMMECLSPLRLQSIWWFTLISHQKSFMRRTSR